MTIRNLVVLLLFGISASYLINHAIVIAIKFIKLALQTEIVQGLGLALLWLGIVLGVLYAAVLILSPTQWYPFEYRVPSANVTIETRPHDCDFRWAPEGEKGCHYEKSVTTFVDSNQQRQVVVSWDKIDDGVDGRDQRQGSSDGGASLLLGHYSWRAA